MERLVVVWCPSLLSEGERGVEARRSRVSSGSSSCSAPGWSRSGSACAPCPPVDRAGSSAGSRQWPTGSPRAVDEVLGVQRRACVGVADGFFAALLAARSQVVVPAGGTAAFLAPWSVAVLRRPGPGRHLAAAGYPHARAVRHPPGAPGAGSLRDRRRRLPPGGVRGGGRAARAAGPGYRPPSPPGRW